MVAGREVTATQADGLWALLSQEVYELLVGSAGWSPAQYQAWVAAGHHHASPPPRLKGEGHDHEQA